MEILQNLAIFVISTLCSKRGGADVALFLWKRCHLQKSVGTYARRMSAKDWSEWRWAFSFHGIENCLLLRIMCGKTRLNPFFKLHVVSEVLHKYVTWVWSDTSPQPFSLISLWLFLFLISREFKIRSFIFELEQLVQWMWRARAVLLCMISVVANLPEGPPSSNSLGPRNENSPLPDGSLETNGNSENRNAIWKSYNWEGGGGSSRRETPSTSRLTAILEGSADSTQRKDQPKQGRTSNHAKSLAEMNGVTFFRLRFCSCILLKNSCACYDSEKIENINLWLLSMLQNYPSNSYQIFSVDFA